MRIRSSLALALGTLTCLAPLAAAKPKAKAKPKDTKPAGDAKPIDMGSAPLPGDSPAAGSAAPATTGAGAATGAGATVGAGGANAGAAVEMTDDDKPSDDPTGTKENPNAPHVGDDDAPIGVNTTAPPPRPTGYPIQEVLRPITLPQSTSEVAIDLRTAFDHADAEGVLRARYGITRQIQAGLIYDIGGVFSDAAPVPSNKFNTGKAAGVEGSYLLTDWVAIHVRVPFYMQPFAMGLTLGAPMKFRFGDRFAITAFDNLVDITLDNKFTPDLSNEAANRAFAAESMTNPVRHDGNLRFLGAAIYQLDDKTALIGSTGFVEPNFGHNGANAQYPLEGIVQWSPSPKLDLAGRLGFDDLAQAKDTIGIRFTAAFRI
jgi:hypothetical protein